MPYYETITLKGGAQVIVNFSDKGLCKKCKAEIVWATSLKTKKYMPICKGRDGQWMSHFVDCPYAKEFRNKDLPAAGDLFNEVQRQMAREKW